MTDLGYRPPSILSEIPSDDHVVIEASAGTGKTYTLKHLVVDLLVGGAELDEILVVTFTRRATADLKRQIRTTLADIAGLDDHTAGEDHIDNTARRRVRSAMLNFDRAEIYTIHSFCQKLLTEYAFFNGRLFDLQHVDENSLFEECAREFLRGPASTNPEYRRWLDHWLDQRVDGDPENLIDNLLDVYQAQQNGAILRRPIPQPPIEELPTRVAELCDRYASSNKKRKCAIYHLKTVILQKLLPPVVEQFQQRKENDGLYCYDDMLSMVAETLRDAEAGDENARAFIDTVRNRYRHALVDECQDTDPKQWEIFRRLFADSADDHRLFIIGDPKQAIYGFRGADVWTYLTAKKQLTGDVLRLENNWRSTESMVDAYNRIFDQRADNPFFSNELINYEKPVDSRPAGYGEHRVRYADDNKTPPAITALRIHEEEDNSADDIRPRWLDYIGGEIESLLYGERRLETRDTSEAERWSAVNAGDIFVLTNTNSEAHQIGNLLRDRGIPYAFYRQEGLFQSHQAMDTLALLEAIEQPGDRSLRRAAFRTPFFAVPLRHLRQFDEEWSAGETARRKLDEWRDSAEEREFHILFDDILHESGILRREILFGDGERALTNYQQIFETLTERANSTGADLRQLIDWLRGRIDEDTEEDDDAESDDNIQRLETDRPAVQVMTMHKSKGLEAEVVFIYGGFSGSGGGGAIKTFIDADLDDSSVLEQDDLPRAAVVSSKKDFLTEEQYDRLKMQNDWDNERLMYVAITRAKSKLYLCYASAPDPYGYGRGGRHEVVVRALDRLHDERDELPDDEFEFVDIGPVGSHPESRKPDAVDTADWRDAVAQLDDQADTTETTADLIRGFDTARNSTRETVSFSGLKHFEGTEPIELRVSDEEDDEDILEEVDATAVLRGDRFDEDTPILGGGIRPGNFLHDILEHLPDYESALASDGVDDWASLSAVRDVIDEMADRYGIEDDYRHYTETILFDTLRTPLELPGGVALDGIAAAERHAVEVPFQFPIPQEDLSFVDWPDDGPRIEEGWVVGDIDVVFRHDGRTYIADWKSNYRPDYSPEALAGYVDNTYALQARLYTLGAIRLLGITDRAEYDERFGGCGYLFVRAITPDRPGDGVLWRKPSWDTVLQWDARLRDEWVGIWRRPLSTFTPEFTQGTP